MSIMPYHKRYHSDALTGCMDLTLEERGAYQTIQDLIYDRAGPIRDDERLIAGYMNVSTRKYRSMRDVLIAKGKIRHDENGNLVNDRAIKEIELALNASQRLRENGRKGGRMRTETAKKPNQNNAESQAGLKPGSSEVRIQSYSNTAVLDSGPLNSVKQAFELGVSLLTKSGIDERTARSMVGKWRKTHGDEKIVRVLSDAERLNISSPIEWVTKALQVDDPEDDFDFLIERSKECRQNRP